ncbi:MAG: WecB/TagA/CpsF family glycosyltransferase [Acidimicrobiaceae bacterium]|nr:WecB/TagA/CpsF family glycosyltransferase [Acidimicrobiaceae bacterium]
MRAAVDVILAAARERRFFQVATVNSDFLVNSRRDVEVQSILAATALNLADGAPVAWATRLLGRGESERIAGADLVPALIAGAAAENLRVFLLGGEDGVARATADRFLAKYPRLEISVYEPPRASLHEMDDNEILRRIQQFQPHILLVAFGHPKQDKWINRNRDALPMVAIGVGCTLDLLAGQRDRAPAWMQRAGLEWVYRLAHEPRRLALRYAIDGRLVAFDLVPAVISARLGHPG